MTNLQPVSNIPIFYKNGGLVSYVSDTTLSIASVIVRSNADNLDINVGDYFGAATATVLNAATNGLNGLDTGSLAASTVYAVYAIADQANYNPSGFLLSTSLTAPVMPNGVFPSNYNSFQRIGYAVTDASAHFKALRAVGNGTTVTYTYNIPIKVLDAGTSATQAAVDLSAVVPAQTRVPVDVGCDFVSDAASKKATICASGASIASSRFILNAQVAAVHVIQDYTVNAALISGVPKIDYIISAATSSLDLYVNGFTDFLG